MIRPYLSMSRQSSVSLNCGGCLDSAMVRRSLDCFRSVYQTNDCPVSLVQLTMLHEIVSHGSHTYIQTWSILACKTRGENFLTDTDPPSPSPISLYAAEQGPTHHCGQSSHHVAKAAQTQLNSIDYDDVLRRERLRDFE